MKILFIIPIYFNEVQVKIFQSLGGGERYPFELARYLKKTYPKDEIQLMVFGISDKIFKQYGFNFNIVKGIKLFPKTNKNFSPLPISLNFIKSILWADVIHGFHSKADTMLLSGLVCKLNKKPFLLTDLGGGSKFSISRLVNIEPLVDSALCISEYDQSLWRIKNKQVVYGGVDINKYSYKKKKEKYILYVGRILPHKAVDTLIKAMPDNYKLIVAGRTYDLEYLSYIKELSRNKDITIIENPEDKDIEELYQNATCFVLPSTHKDYKGNIQKKTELFGLVVIEAMASGAPVIVSSAGPLPELVRAGYNGFIFQDGDVGDLSSKINKIINDENLVIEMGKRSRKLVEEKYDWRIIVKNVHRVYENILIS